MAVVKMSKIVIEGSDLNPYIKQKLVFIAKGTGKTEKQVALSLIEWAIRNEKLIIEQMVKNGICGVVGLKQA